MKKTSAWRKHKRLKFFAFSGIGLVCVIAGMLLVTSQSLLAQSADNLLRPVLGEKKTLLLESWYFTLLDTANRLKYHLSPQEQTPFTTNVAVKRNYSKAGSFLLGKIAVAGSLPSLADEGVWENIPVASFPGQIVMAKTFMRPDTSTPYAIVSLVKMNMKKLGIGIEAGTYYPGGFRKMYGPGYVPLSIQKSGALVAVFNGGFQEKDGHYGMVVGDKTYVPLRSDLPALVIYKDGTASISAYAQIFNRKDIVAIRQNGPLLISNGVITPFVEESVDSWGRTTTNSMYTWRSGIGITKNGNVVYAVGNSLVPQTLAKALLAAGAINALQLDINPFWVRFILYNSLGSGKYSYTPLLKDMQNGGYNYLHSYNKDFFYVYER